MKKIFFLNFLLILVSVTGCTLVSDKTNRAEEVVFDTCKNDCLDNVSSTQSVYENKDLGFSLSYDDTVLTLDRPSATLSHTLKEFHRYSLKDGSDQGLGQDIKIIFSKDSSYCDQIQTDLKGLEEDFSYAAVSGQKYEMGAEGEGVVYYCIKDQDQKNIFQIERHFLNEAYSLNLEKQSDYLNSARQVEIFDEMMATFKFTN